MSVVEIRRRRPEDGEIERLALVFVRVEGGPAEVEVLVPEFREGLEAMLADGITDDVAARFLRLEDGQAFIDALPRFYRGSRFWAQRIEAMDA